MLDPIVTAAIIAVVGYALSGWIQNWVEKRRTSYTRRLELYESVSDTIDRLALSLEALQAFRAVGWQVKGADSALQVVLRLRVLSQMAIVTGAESETQSAQQLLDRADTLADEIVKETVRDPEDRTFRTELLVRDVYEAFVLRAQANLDAFRRAAAHGSLLTNDRVTIKAFTEMTDFLRNEVRDTSEHAPLGPQAKLLGEADLEAKASSFELRRMILLAAMRDDLQRNRGPTLFPVSPTMIDEVLENEQETVRLLKSERATHPRISNHKTVGETKLEH